MKKKIVVLSGAGLSAESGLKTFRDMNGLWENHRVEDVATPEAWERDAVFVHKFYNARRKQLLECKPNDAHKGIANWENKYDVNIITQNVDDLHERGGSSNVLHLHGELKKCRSTVDANLIYDVEGWELSVDDKCEKGSMLRPHIVWFGEDVPAIVDASCLVEKADIVVIVGTSMNVYPAAGLVDYAKHDAKIYLIDPNKIAVNTNRDIEFIRDKAVKGISILSSKLGL